MGFHPRRMKMITFNFCIYPLPFLLVSPFSLFSPALHFTDNINKIDERDYPCHFQAKLMVFRLLARLASFIRQQKN